MEWALFGYSTKEPHGAFIAEAHTKEELEPARLQAIIEGFTSFSYGHADGTLPNFAKTVNVGGRIA